MATLPGEIADAIVAGLEEPGVQAEITTLVTSGETSLEGVVTTFINSIKVGGLGALIATPVKAALVTAVTAEVAKYPPATIVAFITKMAQDEAKALGG